jgi:hypothetical protein
VSTVASGNNTMDLRLDPNYALLTGKPNSVAAISQFPLIPGVSGPPLGTAPTSAGENSTIQPYGLYTRVVSPLDAANPRTSRVYLPPGQYIVAVEFRCDVAGPQNAGCFMDLNPANGIYPASTHNEETYDVTNFGTLSYFHATYIVDMHGPDPWFQFTPNTGLPHFQEGQLTITPTFSPETTTEESGDNDLMDPSPDFGMVSEIRPVAMSVLVTCEQSLINAGGMISACRVSGGTANKQYTSNGNNYGQLQFREQLGTCPKAITNNFIKGCYTFWMQDDIDDKQFYAPSKHIQHEYPSIIVSGDFSPNDPQNRDYVIAQVKIVRVFEYTTGQQSEEVHSTVCVPSEYGSGMALLAQVPWSCENPKHTDYMASLMNAVKTMLGAGWNFYKDNSTAINGLAMKAVMAAGLMV